MKKLLFLIVLIAVGVGFFNVVNSRQALDTQTPRVPTAVAKPSAAPERDTEPTNSRGIFVPYWNTGSAPEDFDRYDEVYYFGISAGEKGVNTTDEGYQNIQDVTRNTTGNKQFLTLRLLDTEFNLKLLEDQPLQKKIIAETIALAQEHEFEGVVVDLELSALPFGNIKNKITVFMQHFRESAANADTTLAMTMYGDTYYRGRPYDIPALGEAVDELLIMAYDFHKIRGEPGPNFPLEGRGTYGYDMKKMITDFSKDVPTDKLRVIVGMYGYDWTLGPQGKPLKAATALPLTDIVDMTNPLCTLTSCKVFRDPESAETKITYRDDENYDHVVWYEDEESVDSKTDFLESQGIGKIGYWVYGYW